MCLRFSPISTQSEPGLTVSASVRLGIELLAQLIEVRHLQIRAAANPPAVGLERADDQLDHRGLAGAVRA